MPEIQQIDIKSLTLLDKNPRKISKDQFDKLCKSLSEDPDYFLNRPCLVNSSNGILTVYAGNQRVRAAKKLKWKKVPCIVEHDLQERIVASRTIKDNKTLGEFDFEVLANEWDVEILLDAGFTHKDFELGVEIKDDSENNEDSKKTKLCPHCGKEI